MLILQQPGIDVVGPLTVTGLIDDHGYQHGHFSSSAKISASAGTDSIWARESRKS